MSDTQQRIDALVKSSDILLFMKGSASFPMCGFSGRAIQILKACGVDPKSVVTVNVLEDDAIRQGIKEYSNWPTIPQLYVKGGMAATPAPFQGFSHIEAGHVVCLNDSVTPTHRSMQ